MNKQRIYSGTSCWLALLVHAEAFCRAPWSYLLACWWRLIGKRARARGQFAPLLSRTSRAYQWWALQASSESCPSPPGTPPIVALVMGEKGAQRIDATFAALESEGIPAFLIGVDTTEDIGRAATEIDWAPGPWMLLLAAGDRIAPGAAQAYRKAMQGAERHVIFADDDLIDSGGQRAAPHFKPDWNAELFAHHDFLTGACVLRTDRASLEAVADKPDWATALVARAIAAGDGAIHLRQVLHHRRQRPSPRVEVKPLPLGPDLPKVSVVIPTRNRVDLLATCIAGLEATNYPSLEVIVVDNDSDDPATLEFLAGLPNKGMRVIRHSGAFNYSAINNRAVAEATGELLCLLNNDIEMLDPNWLAIMATQALREDVGAVGAQLLYPDGRIQHAGVVIGVGNAAGHAHRFLKPNKEGYFRRHMLPQFVTAVTAACLVVRRDKFLAVGGLDETNFPVAFNDVDLCLRLNQRGWQSFYEPRAVLIHHESVSRGFDKDPIGAARFAGELAALQRLWKTDEIVDPFHHPQLSRASEQFALAL